jgi:hypothetical protein
MCSAKHVEKLFGGTEGLGLPIVRNDGLKFNVSEIYVDTFRLKALTIVKTMNQTKTDSV